MSDSCASSHECPSIPQLGVSEKSTKSVDECDACKCVSQYSCIESVSSGFEKNLPKHIRKIDYKRAKLILKQPSSVTGDNLFDHLVETIQNVIDERPINVADYFEEYSRKVRVNSIRERLCLKTCFKPQFLELSTAVMNTFKPPQHPYELEEMCDEEGMEENQMSHYTESSFGKIERTLATNENTLQLQHFWGFCGLGFQIDEIFQLSLAIQRILYHRIIRNARFWGRIFGLHGSYYIVEATLTKCETENRLEMMKSNLLGDMIAFINKRDHDIGDTYIDPDLIPGVQWQDYPKEDLDKMQPVAEGIPVLKIPMEFDPLPESVGIGLNRRVYFVATSLSAEWKELPIVTPKQIQLSKKIKKYFTGNLDAKVCSYPQFPGTEKNYLRAMIARITAGTYIAPEGYYRRMTKKEIRDMDKEVKIVDEENQELENEGEEEEEEDIEEEEETYNNDAWLIEDSGYEPIVLEDLTDPCAWFHVRPNILDQGRVLHVDNELAVRQLEAKALLIIKSSELLGEGGEEGEREEEALEEGEEGEEEEMQEEEEEERPPPEVGPDLFTPCNEDENDEYARPWTARYSSLYNTTNQMVMMRSNLWPGAYSFTFEKSCDSIYIGWGMKYVSRCMSLENAPEIQDYDTPDVVFETTDPTPEMEEKWRLYHLRKDMYRGEDELSDISVEYDDVDQ